MTRRLVSKIKSSGLYRTPEWGTRALLHQETFTGPILEPCAGAGDMARVLRSAGYPVFASDIEPAGPNIEQKDALAWQHPFSNVVTNPPFPMAEKLLRHFLPQTYRKVAFLMRLAFLESARRYAFWQEFPATRIHVFTERLSMYPAGEERSEGGVIAMAWYVWDRRLPPGEPVIRFIPPGLRPKRPAADVAIAAE